MEILKSNTLDLRSENDKGLHIHEYTQYLSKDIFVLENYTSSKTNPCTGEGYRKPSFKSSQYCLVVWGCGEFGQHGYNHNDDVILENSLGEIRAGRFLMDGQSPVVLASGSSHTLVLADNDIVFSWGNGTSGQLGNSTCQTSHKPMPVALKPESQIQGIACGARHSLVWTTDGQCYSFGNNFNAQLGYNFAKADFKDNQLKPVLVEFFPGLMVKEVACGARHTLFLLTTGHVMAVGCNQQGQVGNGSTEDVVIPTKLEDLSSISHIACGNSHSLASDEAGQLYAWGYGKAFGTKARHMVSPKIFNQNCNCPVASIAGGDSHSMILYGNGVLYTWGNNYEGQLGLGKSTKYQNEPEPIPNEMLPRPIIQISCGETTCAAVTGKGKLYMWGKNAGLIHSEKPSQYFQFEPYQIEIGEELVKQVSCGAWHVSAIIEKTNKVHTTMVDSEELSNIKEIEPETVARYSVSCDNQDVSTDNKQTTHSVINEKLFTDNQTSPWVTCHKDIERKQCIKGIMDDDEQTTILDNLCLGEEQPYSDVKTSIEKSILNGYAPNTIPMESTLHVNEDGLSFSHFDSDCTVPETLNTTQSKFEEQPIMNEYDIKCKRQNPQTNSKKKSSSRSAEISFAETRKLHGLRKMSSQDNIGHCNVEYSLQPARNVSDDFNNKNVCKRNMKEDPQTNELTVHECSEGNKLSKTMEIDMDILVLHNSEAKQHKRIVRNNTMPALSKTVDPIFVRPQTVPVINLDFQSSPKKLSVHVPKQDQLMKQSLRTIKNMKNFKFREKQSKKVLNGRKKSQSDIDFVSNLEHTCVLPNCPTVAKEIKWTQFRDTHSSPDVWQSADICSAHSGELLPAICSCRTKNNVLTRKGQTNIFIERNWTY